MDLKGLNVLVDGYNLELRKGAGLKSYGLTLIRALRLLGANVDVLFSKKSHGDAVLNEVLFFDANFDGKKDSLIKFFKSNLIKGLVKSLMKVSHKAKSVSIGKIVLKTGFGDDFIDSVGILNLEECYKIANTAYRIFGVKTRITIPKKIDIWHATYPLPIMIRGSKKITTIGDLVPLRLPYTTLDDKPSYYKNIKDSIKESAVIITISEHSKRDILEIFDTRPDKIYVTYPPVMLRIFSTDEENMSIFLKKYNLVFNKYILFVGAIEPRKNVGKLIDAYSMIDVDMPLVIAGKRAWLWEDEINGRNLKGVRLLEYVSTEDLGYLYSGAYCFVFPSLYEGFGLPPLEAMTFGCPVITSKISSLPEVCGDAALYANPYDVYDIKEKMEDLLSNPQLRDKLSRAGKERAKLFSMENYMRQLYEAYSKVF